MGFFIHIFALAAATNPPIPRKTFLVELSPLLNQVACTRSFPFVLYCTYSSENSVFITCLLSAHKVIGKKSWVGCLLLKDR